MPIIVKPTNTVLKQITKEIYANAQAIPSTQGGGSHAHLGLVMLLAEYMLLTGVALLSVAGAPQTSPNPCCWG